MHAAKVILLLVLTLAVMRVASWSLGWLLKRFSTTKRLWIAVLSNGIALAAFGCFLVTQRIPGELIDAPALTFGVLVFSVYALIDVRWTGWGRTESSDSGAS
jgi:hypothetical protein